MDSPTERGSSCAVDSVDQLSGSTPGAVGEAGTAATASKKQNGGKGRRREERYGSSPISLLPPELLTYVFAFLPPAALGAAQLVNREWSGMVSDEASWRVAFETYFDVTPDSLGRRLEPSSWRLEYITRVSLLRQWHRSREPTILHNPSLGAITALHLNLPVSSVPSSSSASRSLRRESSATLTSATLLSVSLPLGAGVHSTPFSGKVSKRPLLSSPIDHLGRPISLPILPATSFGISPDGAKIVWGMRHGSLRFSNATVVGSSGGGGVGTGRGLAGGAGEQGEVRSLEDAHREGSNVQQVAFSNVGGTGAGRSLKGVKQRNDVFVTVGSDGVAAIWTTSVVPTAVAAAAAADGRDRLPPAQKLWQGRWDVAVDLPPTPVRPGVEAPVRPRVKATEVAFDSGWLGRHHGRPATVAIGRSDGKTVVWARIELDEEKTADGTGSEPVVLEGEEGVRVDTLILDAPAESTSPIALLAHQQESTSFSRYVFPSPSSLPLSASTSIPSHTIFSHPLPAQISALTAFAVDFDVPPPPPTSSQPQTPAEGGASKLSFPTSRLLSLAKSGVSSPQPPPLSRTTSDASLSLSLTLPPTASSNDPVPLSARFGRRKYVAAGDLEGRVYLWDWEAKQSDDERERGDVVPPSKRVQGLEIVEGGASASSKVTALEIGEVGVFVGGLDGTLRFYSSLGPSHLLSPPVRSFRDRTAPRHPSRMLAQGLVTEDEEERWLVSHVVASRDAVVAAIGGRILAWRMTSDTKRKGVKANGGKLSARQERFKANLDIQHQVRESISALSAESDARVEAYEELERTTHDYGVPPSLGNMTEEEAIALATMLSLDEQESRIFEGIGEDEEQETGEWEDDSFLLDEDQEQSRASTSGNWREEEDSESIGNTTRGTSRSQSFSASLSVPPSPYLRGSSLSSGTPPFSSPSSRHTWTPVSPSLRAVGSPPSHDLNSKLHISPRLGPTYGSQGAQYTHEEVPDMIEEMWPVVQSPPSSAAASFGSRRPSTAGVPSSPSPSPSALPPAAPSSSAAGLATPVRRGWNDVARSATPSSSTGANSPSFGASSTPSTWPSPSTNGAWTPPASRPSASSLLAEQLRYSELEAREDEEKRRREREQEELDLAIALSLSQAGEDVAGLSI